MAMLREASREATERDKRAKAQATKAAAEFRKLGPPIQQTVTTDGKTLWRHAYEMFGGHKSQKSAAELVAARLQKKRAKGFSMTPEGTTGAIKPKALQIPNID
jgi:hypothetical protein